MWRGRSLPKFPHRHHSPGTWAWRFLPAPEGCLPRAGYATASWRADEQRQSVTINNGMQLLQIACGPATESGGGGPGRWRGAVIQPFASYKRSLSRARWDCRRWIGSWKIIVAKGKTGGLFWRSTIWTARLIPSDLDFFLSPLILFLSPALRSRTVSQ
jgi:hypothetical protein